MAGKLPSEIGYLKLGLLFVNFNSLTGTIPSEVFNISTMRVMTLQENQFSGHLPSDLGIWLPNLVGFYIGSNKFTGLIPSSISNASKLIILEMSSNSFSGPLPNNLGNLRFLQRLYVGENNLTRESSTTELRFLSSLTNCRDLEVLVISLNQLNGVLPAAFGNLSTNLKFLSAFGSKIKGEIPIGIGNLSSLDAMILDSNELTGRIPSTIGMLKNIERIYLEHNRLQGSIPNELCLLDRMGDLYLSHNRLNGSIPACLGELRSLRRLYLDSNKFSSKIPSSLWTRVDLVELNLSTNLLSGDLASEIGKLKVTTQMDLSWNQLSGNIPASIGGAQSLNFFSLAHNKLQGSISQSLGSLLGLEFLDLSNNNLSGKIPKSLEALRYLHYFNVSFNKLEGEIPTGGIFVNFTAQSYMQNYALCGAPRLLVQLCQNRTPHQSGSRNISVKYILTPIAAVILLVVLIFVLRKCRKQNILLTQEDSLPHAWQRVSYIELTRATDGFSETNLLGMGGFGSVYKGTLSDGMIVAVKVFHLQFEGASKSFDAECEVMRNVRHRNLTKLISSCTNLDFKALVLEWMPNRCLEKCLYSQNCCLDILERLNIMIDVASALNYLHHGHPTPIVHCDLKPSNVLLDKDMIAHVCDFGIAKILGEEEFMARTKTLATIGYMAPGIILTHSFSFLFCSFEFYSPTYYVRTCF